MTRDAVERELREKLASVSDRSALSGFVAVLLPWILEMREDAAMQARIDDGQLPHG